VTATQDPKVSLDKRADEAAAAVVPDSRTRVRKALDVIDDRMGISALSYQVPEHANRIAWTLGGITAISLVLLIVTGVVLVQFYSPIPESANQSVRDIVTQVWGGSFVRGLHFWSSQAMYVTAALHMIRVFLTGSYKKPREGNWLVGVAMFGLITLGIFTGTVLKWDQEGYEALGHNIEIGKLLGGFGFWFSPSMAGRIPILVRLFSAHAVVIPGLIIVLVIFHFLLVKRHKMSPHPTLPADASGEQAAATEPTEPFTRHIRRLMAFGVALTGILGFLAVILPPALGSSPVPGIEVTKPPWMFWWPFTLENWFGLPAILYAEITFFLILAAVPFIDRNPKRWWRKRPIAMILGGSFLVILTVLTLLMLVTKAKQHL
jgi:quinol-cytochrome oxidoreductase complex cytochrome b subunit